MQKIIIKLWVIVVLSLLYYYRRCININTLCTLVTTAATAIMAYWAYVQAKLTRKQTNISLYKDRYEHILNACVKQIQTLEKEFAKENPRLENIQEQNTKFFESLNYSQFLIKKTDFDEIRKTFNEIVLKIAHSRNLNSYEARLEAMNYIQYKEKQIFNIMAKYLDVGAL